MEISSFAFRKEKMLNGKLFRMVENAHKSDVPLIVITVYFKNKFKKATQKILSYLLLILDYQ